ncbi:MAG: AraC family transcriptional regulator [Clostridiaceae bacterium]|nr:AraC family transcriptional regulator [Clostridiaceae bacterium]
MMTINELSHKLGLKIITEIPKKLERKVTGVYSCDLLSHAMAKINEGDVWITIHTNLNVVAVASLTDCACVLIPENIEIEKQMAERAAEKEVVLLSGAKSAAELCYEIFRLIKD